MPESKWTTDEPTDDTATAGTAAEAPAEAAPAVDAPPTPTIGPVDDQPGHKVLLPPPLADEFIVAISGGDPIVITQDGTVVDSAYVSWVLDAAEHARIELREKRP